MTETDLLREIVKHTRRIYGPLVHAQIQFNFTQTSNTGWTMVISQEGGSTGYKSGVSLLDLRNKLAATI